MPSDASVYGLLRPVEYSSRTSGNGLETGMAMGMKMRDMRNQEEQRGRENKMQDEQIARAKAQQNFSVLGQALNGLAGMPENERAAAYPQVRNQLVSSGMLGEKDAPEQYDPGFFRSAYGRYQQSAEYLDKEFKKSQIAENKAATAEKYASAQEKIRGKSDASAAPADRLAKMGGEVKTKVGFVTSGLQALTNYENAFRDGGRQRLVDPSTPLLGSAVSSQPIDEARTGLEESIGRLASGGAINKDEEARFRRMLPRAMDGDADAARKLVTLRKDLEGKLTAYGFKAEDLGGIGYDPAALGYGTEHARADGRGLLPKKTGNDGAAFAGRGRMSAMSPQDAEALHWLKQNPNSPDAAGVRAKLQKNGLVE